MSPTSPKAPRRPLKDRRMLWAWLVSIVIHLLIAFFANPAKPDAIEVVDSMLKATPIVAVDIPPPPPTIDAPDTTAKPKAKPKTPPVKPPERKVAKADSLKRDSLVLGFDTTGNQHRGLAMPPYPEAALKARIQGWAEVLIKIDSSGQVTEVGDEPIIEGGISSGSITAAGETWNGTSQDVVTLHSGGIFGMQFWIATRKVASTWNLYLSADSTAKKEDLLRRLPPGKWIRQRVDFTLPKSP